MWSRFVSVWLCFLSLEARGENLLVNPSVEQPTVSQMPPGWGMYLGAGTASLTLASDEKHSGRASACLELTGWHLPKGAADKAENRSASAAIVLAENDGYIAKGSLACRPGTTYAFSFWYKGDVPVATVSVTGWPTADADHTKRISVPVGAGNLQPKATWQQCAGAFRVIEPMRCFVVMIQAGGRAPVATRGGRPVKHSNPFIFGKPAGVRALATDPSSPAGAYSLKATPATCL